MELIFFPNLYYQTVIGIVTLGHISYVQCLFLKTRSHDKIVENTFEYFASDVHEYWAGLYWWFLGQKFHVSDERQLDPLVSLFIFLCYELFILILTSASAVKVIALQGSAKKWLFKTLL